MSDILLRWNVGNALVQATGTASVLAMAEGETRVVFIQHALVPLAFPGVPVVSVTDGPTTARVRAILAGYVDGVWCETDGTGFLLEVELAMAYGGYPSAGAFDVTLEWSRDGVSA